MEKEGEMKDEPMKKQKTRIKTCNMQIYRLPGFKS